MEVLCIVVLEGWQIPAGVGNIETIIIIIIIVVVVPRNQGCSMLKFV
jgi:hypothetical protein